MCAMALPLTYTREIQDLNAEVLRSRPQDILQFCADFFTTRLASERIKLLSEGAPNKRVKLANTRSQNMSSSFSSPFANPFGHSEGGMQKVEEEEENDTITSPTTSGFNNMKSASLFSGPFGGPFGGFDSSHEPPTGLRSPPNTDNFPAQYNFGRRTSVSAESLKPTAEHNDNWQPPVFPKSKEQLERLKSAISENFLFKHMDDEQRNQVLSAMQEKPIPAKGIKVCCHTTKKETTWGHAQKTNCCYRIRSLPKEMLETTFTLSKRADSPSTSTLQDL